MKEQVKEHATIIIENSNEFLKQHPLIESNHFIFIPETRKLAKLNEIIQFLGNQDMKRNIIYLHNSSMSKQMNLLKLRNFHLPDYRIIPLFCPENDAETVHLLNQLTSNLEQALDNLMFGWNTLKNQINSFSIEHTRIEKIRKSAKPVSSTDKYKLFENGQESKKIAKGSLNDLVKMIDEKTEGHIPLIIEEKTGHHYNFYSSLEDFKDIENTIRISISAVKNIGVENSG